jgi:protein gp37
VAKGTPIGWLHQPGFDADTENLVKGCTPRSPGCANCFAPWSVVRHQHLPGQDGLVARDEQGRLAWTGKVITLPERLPALVRAKKPRMIFVTVLGDLFDVQVDDDFLVQLWETMRDSPQHIYVILTKVAKRMHDKVTKMAGLFGVLPNVWIGVSCENQEQANIRIPWLMRAPIAIRVASCEPMLGPIDLMRIPAGSKQQPDMVWDVLNKRYGVPGRWQAPMKHGLDWIIIGGESAARDRARAMHPQWARDLIADVSAAGVALFFKQWGSWRPAPWVVRVCDPDEGWNGTEEELAAAKAAAEKIGATHSLPVWAHQYDMLPRDVGHKCWSLERRPLPAGSPHAPMRWHSTKGGDDVIDGRTWHQWPVFGGGIVDTSEVIEQEAAHA